MPIVDFLRKLSKEIGLEFQVFYPATIEKPTVVLSWVGSEPDTPSILLNSHMDVVPVFEEFWTHKPFAADIDVDGKIFARGAQDMKCVGMQYLGAIRSLKKKNISMKRTLHVVFVPDEEIFGPEGMKAFVLSDSFKGLNVGFALDEGDTVDTVLISIRNNILSFQESHLQLMSTTCFMVNEPAGVSEQNICSLRICFDIVFNPFLDVLFKVYGTPGHGSLLLKNTVAENVRSLLDKIYDYRKTQELILEQNPDLLLGDVTTVNITKMKGGKQRNVLPPFMEITVDVRMAVTVDVVEFEKMLNKWAKESGERIEIEYLVKEPYQPATKTDDSNIYWKALKQATEDLNLKIKPQVFPAGTDAAYVRAAGIPAIGFSPMINTPVLLHDHDEYLNADVYLKGIEIYETLLERIANVQDRPIEVKLYDQTK